MSFILCTKPIFQTQQNGNIWHFSGSNICKFIFKIRPTHFWDISFEQFTLVSAIKAQSEPVTAPDTDEASKAVDILQASIAGFFTRQRTNLKEAKKDIKVGSHTT